MGQDCADAIGGGSCWRAYNNRMSRQEECEAEQYQPAFNGILSINAYEEEEGGEGEEGEGEEGLSFEEGLPFEELQQILADPASVTTRREGVLLLAVNYLQQRCGQLSTSNSYLQGRHQDLLEEIGFLAEVEISQDVAHSFLDAIQQELEDYKTEFRNYREKHLALRKSLLEDNAKLVSRVEELEGLLADGQAAREALEEERKDVLTSNEQLLESNSQLNAQMEDLEYELQSMREERHQGSVSANSRRMEGQVQAELEDMIDKLMGELENERRQRMSLSTECKQLQKQLLHLERELSDKNNKIYQLQMVSLRNNRTSPQPPPSPRGPRTAVQRPPARQETSSFRTFSLATVGGGGGQFSRRTRLVIAVKVVEFYLRKAAKGDMTTHMLEGLLVYNYSSLYPQACIIRKDKGLPSKEGQCTQERLVWNLAFLLDHLLTNDGQEILTKPEAQMAALISSILEEHSCTLSDAEELRALAEEASRMGK